MRHCPHSAQTEKMKFSFKDDCILSKHTWRCTYSPMRLQYDLCRTSLHRQTWENAWWKLSNKLLPLDSSQPQIISVIGTKYFCQITVHLNSNLSGIEKWIIHICVVCPRVQYYCFFCANFGRRFFRLNLSCQKEKYFFHRCVRNNITLYLSGIR